MLNNSWKVSESNRCLLSAYYSPDTILSTLYILMFNPHDKPLRMALLFSICRWKKWAERCWFVHHFSDKTEPRNLNPETTLFSTTIYEVWKHPGKEEGGNLRQRSQEQKCKGMKEIQKLGELYRNY